MAETSHYRDHFMAFIQELDMHVSAVDLDADVLDIRMSQETYPAFHEQDDYGAGQALERHLRAKDRAASPTSACAIRQANAPRCSAARLLANCRQERHLCCGWDGRAITTVHEKVAFKWTA
ncbi:hypothetical protein GGR39_003355 [Novosphingobium fluoreni]|uniref:Uncharacterized protein n=1 Tax=Novosphingobium fluoreni TaxID=1391222 RepID=A0A7W6C1D4_9SPHN|nr:hypothetical protein [Novosphingobium fluoreni]